jgi:hypothetical protein
MKCFRLTRIGRYTYRDRWGRFPPSSASRPPSRIRLSPPVNLSLLSFAFVQEIVMDVCERDERMGTAGEVGLSV